ncbi:LLM class flavin-dependent oxidoreductase [Sphingobium boeckii]|uniref:Alkanesulfonate monooxygenase SsuD/methylene tetrahydromethanopterin reductase-like flavin-dependent oxidoreductase (Luciferase family) n=1 Tax=Sphingobium boeckii TaxID=1082345 RepID=A0A7W9ED82_9SPHN|nr:LLM class flavin-dependent oxidoreductase [Sphingobium boeckii]MBB5684842.1 alkanesulfonate monooxygenase SsuD/methylene tetrahydromethanopterin reductase-like flavin-dependent oxidoreductase (luciferase family) [Sphingobium boeckii]
MRFGFSLLPLSLGPEHDEWMMEAEIRLGVLADELGYDMVLVGERHFSGMVGGNPLLSVATLAPRLKTAWLGTGVTIVPNYHPVRLAEMLNIVDHLTKGKVIFGLGSGMSPEDAVAFGFDISKQNDQMFNDGIEALLALWAKRREDPPRSINVGTYHGTLLERITPTPYRKARPFLKTTAATPRHIERAAREGWPIFFIKRDAEDARELFTQYRTALLSHGHDEAVLAHCAEWTSIAKPSMHIAMDDATAAEEWAFLNAQLSRFIERKIDYGAQARALQGVDKPLPGVQDRAGAEFRKKMTVHGGVSAIIEHVREIHDAGFGMFHLSLISPTDEESLAIVERSMRMFAQKVMPLFKGPVRPFAELG